MTKKGKDIGLKDHRAVGKPEEIDIGWQCCPDWTSEHWNMTNMVNRIELKIDLTRICDRSKRKHAIVIFLQGHTWKSSSFFKLLHRAVHLDWILKNEITVKVQLWIQKYSWPRMNNMDKTPCLTVWCICTKKNDVKSSEWYHMFVIARYLNRTQKVVWHFTLFFAKSSYPQYFPKKIDQLLPLREASRW